MIPGRDGQTVLAAMNEFGCPTHIGRDHWHAHGHRLDEYDPEGLVVTRESEDMCRFQLAADVSLGHGARQAHRVVEVQFCHECLQVAVIWPGSGAVILSWLVH